VECGVCSKESFAYITAIIFARRKQLCTCAHKIMKGVYCIVFALFTSGNDSILLLIWLLLCYSSFSSKKPNAPLFQIVSG